MNCASNHVVVVKSLNVISDRRGLAILRRYMLSSNSQSSESHCEGENNHVEVLKVGEKKRGSRDGD